VESADDALGAVLAKVAAAANPIKRLKKKKAALEAPP
jgi:hypothetical protein